jgi:tRNA nucleotidyltransferase/poly(A) polymerase
MNDKELLLSILNAPDPSAELIKLDESGVLDKLLPELTALKGVDSIDGQQHKDNFAHTLQVLKQTAEVSQNPYLRLVAILHDAGKAPTKRFDKERGWTFHDHENVSAKMSVKLFNRLNLDIENLDYVSTIIKFHGITKALTEPGVTDTAIKRFYNELGEYVSDLLLFCSCDMTTKSEAKRLRFRKSLIELHERITSIKESEEAKLWRSPITGDFIMKELDIKPSKRLGNIKSEIERAIKANEVEDNFESAYKYLYLIKDKFP